MRDKRQAILTAARELFAGQGYEETTIAEIARAAGVAVGTVYLYFQNKHDVLVDVCLALKAEVAQVIQSPEILALPLQQVPRAVIEATFRTSRKNLRFMNSFQVEGQSPAEVARLQGAQDEVSGALNAYFQAVIAQRQAPPFDTAVYAEMLNNLVSATFSSASLSSRACARSSTAKASLSSLSGCSSGRRLWLVKASSSYQRLSGRS